MDEYIFSEFPDDFIQALEQTSQAPSPQPAFVDCLERQLLERQKHLINSQQPLGRLQPRKFSLHMLPAWQAVLLIVLTALVVFLLAVGPGRVLAEVQRLLGYIPGVGFIELDVPLILAEPIPVQQDEILWQVDQVIADRDGTLILISSMVLSEERIIIPPVLEYQFEAKLHLLDGRELSRIGWSMGTSQIKIEFPALPKGIDRIGLVLNCLPVIAQVDCVPGDWQVDLQLVPATVERFSGRLALSYDPQVSAEANGLRLRVGRVAHNDKETAVELQFEWEDSTWRKIGAARSELSDDLGHPYILEGVKGGRLTTRSDIMVVTEIPPDPQDPPTGQVIIELETHTFSPLSSQADQLTLTIDWIEFETPASGEFSLDLGPYPQIGQTWTLDQTLQVLGMDVRLLGARLSERFQPRYSGESFEEERLYWLEFIFQAEQQPDRRLSYISAQLVNESAEALFVKLGEAGGGTRGMIQAFGSVEMPRGVQTYRLDSANVVLRGPWQMTWPLPEPTLRATTIPNFHPREAVMVREDLLLQLERVLVSDLASRVQVSAPTLPPESELLHLLGRDPFSPTGSSATDLFLRDRRGRRYELSRIWPPVLNERYDPHKLEFDPLPSAPGVYALHIPAVELSLPGRSRFSVDVPEGLPFSTIEWTEIRTLATGEEYDIMLRKVISPVWEVDITVEMAGYIVRFNRAYLRQADLLENYGAFQLVLTGLPLVKSQDGLWLRQMDVAAIHKPDGGRWLAGQASWSPFYRHSPSMVISPQTGAAQEPQAELVIDVTAENGVQVLPGKYEIELSGLTVIVPGPWDLNFTLSN
jgi:hypothetical protein